MTDIYEKHCLIEVASIFQNPFSGNISMSYKYTKYKQLQSKNDVSGVMKLISEPVVSADVLPLVSDLQCTSALEFVH